MREYDSKRVLISLHIPKCGGNSIELILRSWFRLGYFRHYYNHNSNTLPRRIPYLKKIQKILPICVHGHFDHEEEGTGVDLYYPDSIQYITILRDPLEMHLSLFFYMRKLYNEGALFWEGRKVNKEGYNWDIDDWVENRPFFMFRFMPFVFTEDNYKVVVDKHFVHIGVVSNYQKSINILAEKLKKKAIPLNIKNVTERDQMPSEISITKFKKKHTLEYLLYNYACTLNQ